MIYLALAGFAMAVGLCLTGCNGSALQQPKGQAMSVTDLHQNIGGASCISCHTGDRPKSAVKGFVHSAGGAGDCLNCHEKPAESNQFSFQGGSWSHNPAPTECASCHRTDDGLQSFLVGSIHQMAHSVPGLPDCATCHFDDAKASGWSKWNVEAVPGGNSLPRTQKGVFHSAVTTVKTCYSCHLAERPDGPVGVNNFIHDDQGAIGDCVNCHGTFPQNTGLQWKMSL